MTDLGEVTTKQLARLPRHLQDRVWAVVRREELEVERAAREERYLRAVRAAARAESGREATRLALNLYEANRRGRGRELTAGEMDLVRESWRVRRLELKAARITQKNDPK